MKSFPIVCYPANILRRKAEKVSSVTPEIQTLIPRMIKTMYEADGIGLAAPQIGISQRLIIVETAEDPRDINEKSGKPVAFLNPTLLEATGPSIKAEEGCLSLPGIFIPISRKEHVKVKCQTEKGESVEIEASGLIARIFQHEIDHLNGKLIIHRINPFARFKLRKKLAALGKKANG